tara:strand:+ start:86 stop:418 length:333 start_codon:yes stop_codon:yes gene_type:complete
MRDKIQNKWWVYINGYRVVETKSIGYKWVRYRTSEYSRYKKIKRSAWDKSCIRSLSEHQYRLDIRNLAKDIDIPNLKKSRKKFGWSYKTFDELESEVLKIKKYLNSLMVA